MSSLPVGERSIPRTTSCWPLSRPLSRSPVPTRTLPAHFVRAHLGIREVRKKSAQSVSHRVLGVCFTEVRLVWGGLEWQAAGEWCSEAEAVQGAQSGHSRTFRPPLVFVLQTPVRDGLQVGSVIF